MDPASRRMEWQEETTAQSYCCHFRERNREGCSIVAVILGAPVLLFLAYFGPDAAGGGFLPTFGVLEMAIPTTLMALLALREDRTQLRPQRIRLDRDRLEHWNERGEHRSVATAGIADFAADPHALVARDREGKPLLCIGASSPAFLRDRLQAALDRLRMPLTYRA